MKLEEGKKLIALARSAIKNKPTEIKGFEKKSGVFVTILSYPNKELLGCIGFPKAVKPLKEAVVDAARAAAYSDPRFEPIDDNTNFILEISLLSPLELIKDPLNSFSVGAHGLIVELDNHYGLLLPQVFVDYKSSEKGALEMTCEKAGLERNAWKDPKCRIYKFKAQVFIEVSPNGDVIEEI